MPTTRSSGYGSAGLDTVRGGERLYAWMLPSYYSAFEFAARACETARQVRDPLPHFGKKKKIRKFDRVTAANMPLFAAFLLRTEAHRGWFLGAVCILCTVKIWGLCCLCSQWRAVHKWKLFVLGSYAWECSKRGPGRDSIYPLENSNTTSAIIWHHMRLWMSFLRSRVRNAVAIDRATR